LETENEETMEYLQSTDFPELESKLKFLRQCLSKEAYEQMHFCRFQTGEYLFREGKEWDYLYIILDGNCKVFRTLENGKTLLVCCYQDIQLLGEFEIFGDSVAKTNIQALKETYCLAISARRHKALLMSDNQFLQFACSQICEKIERNNRNTGINLLYPLEKRLAGYILIMQNEDVFSGNYTMLAEYLGCSHRHLLRTFHMLCDKNLLEKRNTAYWIKDKNALERLAGGVYQ